MEDTISHQASCSDGSRSWHLSSSSFSSNGPFPRKSHRHGTHSSHTPFLSADHWEAGKEHGAAQTILSSSFIIGHWHGFMTKTNLSSSTRVPPPGDPRKSALATSSLHSTNVPGMALRHSDSHLCQNRCSSQPGLMRFLQQIISKLRTVSSKPAKPCSSQH